MELVLSVLKSPQTPMFSALSLASPLVVSAASPLGVVFAVVVAVLLSAALTVLANPRLSEAYAMAALLTLNASSTLNTTHTNAQSACAGTLVPNGVHTAKAPCTPVRTALCALRLPHALVHKTLRVLVGLRMHEALPFFVLALSLPQAAVAVAAAFEPFEAFLKCVLNIFKHSLKTYAFCSLQLLQPYTRLNPFNLSGGFSLQLALISFKLQASLAPKLCVWLLFLKAQKQPKTRKLAV